MQSNFSARSDSQRAGKPTRKHYELKYSREILQFVELWREEVPVWKRKLRITPLGVLAVLALISVAVAFGMVQYIFSQSTSLLFSTRPDVQVPELTGMTRQQAENDAQATQLELVWQQSYDSTVPQGSVCRQSARVGRTVKAGQRLVLTESLGPDLRNVPELWGMAKEDAYQKIRDEGFVLSVEFIEDGTVEPYTVIKTDPAAGTQLQAGDIVTVQVARPQPDPFRTVPSLLGLSLAEAKRQLAAVALQPLTIPSNALEGTVAAQDPLPGSLLRINKHVILTVG